MVEHALRLGALDHWLVVDGCWAQPEGTPEEWRTVVEAIKAGRSEHSARRVAVEMDGTGYARIYSPRNEVEDNGGVLLAPDELPGWVAAAEATIKQALDEVDNGDGI